MKVNYDRLAGQYRVFRKPDPRIAERIHYHISKFNRILNVGAGMGSYEPENREVYALEASLEMIAMRKAPGKNSVQGHAERLPFKDRAFDASMGVLTIHHWRDIASGLKEMKRVTRHKIVLLTWIGYANDFWLEEYIPEIRGVDARLFPTLDELREILGNISVDTIEIPHDCTDGFMCAYWRRPGAYLDPNVRKAISTFSRVTDVSHRLERLKSDIESGEWARKYSHLIDTESLDLGYRLVVAEI